MNDDNYLNALLSNKLSLIKMPKSGNMIHFASFSNILTDSDGLILQSVIEPIQRSISAGDYVIPVTARPAAITKTLCEKLGLETWIAYGGGTVCLNNEIIMDKVIDPQIVDVICKIATENGMGVISDKDGIISCDNQENVFARYEMAVFGQLKPVLDFNQNDNHRKIILTVPNQFRKQVMNFPGIIKSELVRLLSGDLRTDINNLSVAITHASCYIEITAARKSYGVDIIRTRLDIPFERTSGTGYSGDDIDLWKAVALPIAMNFTPSIFSKDAIFKTASFAEVLNKLS